MGPKSNLETKAFDLVSILLAFLGCAVTGISRGDECPLCQNLAVVNEKGKVCLE